MYPRRALEAVTLKGSTVADEPIEASFVDDGDGRGVLRVVDAAPFAYDAIIDALRTVPVYGKAQIGSERLTSLAAAEAMTPTAGAIVARVYCEAGEVRVTDTGVAATATTGIIIGEGQYDTIYNPADGSIIETAAGSIVTVVYY
jgi:hypothetical protein